MAKTVETEDTSRLEPGSDEFYADVASKYEQEDEAAPQDEEDGSDEAHETDGDDDASHTDEETDSDGSDGAEESSDEELDDEDDDTDTGEDDDSEAESDDESDDDAEADEGEDADEEKDDEEGKETEDDESDDVSEDTTSALAAHGAKLSLDDVPEKFRPIVKEKLRNIDAAFTRTMQHVRAYRAEEAQFRADQKYREENPDLLIVELLQKDPKLIEKVNARITKLDPTVEGNDETSISDYRAALEDRIASQKQKAAAAIQQQFEAHESQLNRAKAIEQSASAQAAKFGLPLNDTLQALIAAAIDRKPNDQKDLSEAEVTEIVRGYARDHRHLARTTRRQESRDRIKQRAGERGKPKPTVKPPKGAASPGASREQRPKGDLNDPEYRQRLMLRTAKRVFPGARD